MKAWTYESLRAFALIVVGAFIVFWFQPLLYRNGLLSSPSDDVVKWLNEDYRVASNLVFSLSLLATLMWLLLAYKAPIKDFKDAIEVSSFWWLLFLIPFMATNLSLLLLGGEEGNILLSSFIDIFSNFQSGNFTATFSSIITFLEDITTVLSNASLNSDEETKLLPLTTFYIFDVLILYWLPTASSTPGLLKYMVPLSFSIRRFLGS